MIDNQKNQLIELEIQSLLTNHQELEFVVDALTKKYDDEPLTDGQMERICQFLLASGYIAPLLNFLIEHIETNKNFPFAYYAEALLRSGKEIPDEIRQALIQGAQDLNKLEDLARSRLLDSFDSRLISIHQSQEQKRQQAVELLREDFLLELQVLHSQGMHEQREKKIAQALKFFPNDEEFSALEKDFQDQRAQRMINQDNKGKGRHIPIELYQAVEPEVQTILDSVESSMHEYFAENGWTEALAKDFAIAQTMWQNHSAALALIDSTKISKMTRWLRAEILIHARRFVDLLEELDVLELLFAHDPESTSSIIYLRAQALWGLDQKAQAISMMESLVKSKHHYRSADSLLAEWKGLRI